MRKNPGWGLKSILATVFLTLAFGCSDTSINSPKLEALLEIIRGSEIVLVNNQMGQAFFGARTRNVGKLLAEKCYGIFTVYARNEDKQNIPVSYAKNGTYPSDVRPGEEALAATPSSMSYFAKNGASYVGARVFPGGDELNVNVEGMEKPISWSEGQRKTLEMIRERLPEVLEAFNIE